LLADCGRSRRRKARSSLRFWSIRALSSSPRWKPLMALKLFCWPKSFSLPTRRCSSPCFM
jgi:hypothetical protein